MSLYDISLDREGFSLYDVSPKHRNVKRGVVLRSLNECHSFLYRSKDEF